jgi:predicted nucleic-acid-binding Zn-ribbon protein
MECRKCKSARVRVEHVPQKEGISKKGVKYIKHLAYTSYTCLACGHEWMYAF